LFVCVSIEYLELCHRVRQWFCVANGCVALRG
jgi:hypothetical protein